MPSMILKNKLPQTVEMKHPLKNGIETNNIRKPFGFSPKQKTRLKKRNP